MDLDKAWLYGQGTWAEVDDPAAQFPEELDELFEKLHYNPAPRTYGVPGEHSVTIYYGPLFPKEKGAPIAYPDYPYYVEVEVEGVTDHHFYIEARGLGATDKRTSILRIFPHSARTYLQGRCFLPLSEARGLHSSHSVERQAHND